MPNDFSFKWGTIALLDFLGWKGVWINDYKNNVYSTDTLNETSLQKLYDLIQKIKSLCEEDSKCELISISDTIALFCECENNNEDNYKTLKKQSRICSNILDISALDGFPLRGAITVGQYAHLENIFVGPGVDECASWYEQANWLGVIFAPSAQFIIDIEFNKNKTENSDSTLCKKHSREHIYWRDDDIVAYDLIPIKDGFRGINYCVSWGKASYVLNKVLENTVSLSREIAIKYINTNKYLYTLRPNKEEGIK